MAAAALRDAGEWGSGTLLALAGGRHGNSPGPETNRTEEANVRAGIPTILVVVLLIVLLVWLL